MSVEVVGPIDDIVQPPKNPASTMRLLELDTGTWRELGGQRDVRRPERGTRLVRGVYPRWSRVGGLLAHAVRTCGRGAGIHVRDLRTRDVRVTKPC